MRILAVSDQVSDSLYSPFVRERLGEVDCIISCGDLPIYYLDFLASMICAPVYYVFGNHDMGFEYKSDGLIEYGVPGAVNLDGRTEAYHGLLLAGLEGSIRYRPDGVFQYTQGEMRAKALALAAQLAVSRMQHGRPLDILVTHSPPFGIHDGSDVPHVGFRVFLTLMRRFRPRYLLHGHKHVYGRERAPVTRFVDTTVINVYPFRVLDVEVPGE